MDCDRGWDRSIIRTWLNDTQHQHPVPLDRPAPTALIRSRVGHLWEANHD